MVDVGVATTIVGEWLSSRSGGIPRDDEADKVVDPPLEVLDVFPLGSTKTIRGDFIIFTLPEKTTGVPPK